MFLNSDLCVSNREFDDNASYLCIPNRNNSFKVKINEIIELTNSKVVVGGPKAGDSIEKAFSSDLMSDVLTLDEENILLITGLANIQLIRTAEMADIRFILLARNKKASPEMIQLADENGMVLLETPYSIFRASGILFSNGLKPVY